MLRRGVQTLVSKSGILPHCHICISGSRSMHRNWNKQLPAFPTRAAGPERAPPIRSQPNVITQGSPTRAHLSRASCLPSHTPARYTHSHLPSP